MKTVSSNGNPPNPQLCSRCKAVVTRPKQKYCLGCHAASSRFYRKRNKQEFVSERAARANLVLNQDTLQKFEREVGCKHVIVISEGGDRIEYSGVVTEFLPYERLSVCQPSGKMTIVDLNRVRPNRDRWV